MNNDDIAYEIVLGCCTASPIFSEKQWKELEDQGFVVLSDKEDE